MFLNKQIKNVTLHLLNVNKIINNIKQNKKIIIKDKANIYKRIETKSFEQEHFPYKRNFYLENSIFLKETNIKEIYVFAFVISTNKII